MPGRSDATEAVDVGATSCDLLRASVAPAQGPWRDPVGSWAGDRGPRTETDMVALRSGCADEDCGTLGVIRETSASGDRLPRAATPPRTNGCATRATGRPGRGWLGGNTGEGDLAVAGTRW